MRAEGSGDRPRRLGSAREPALDGLRGLAAVVVVVHHALLVLPAPRSGGWGGSLRLAVALWPGVQCVHLFFVLSGLVLTASVLRRRPFPWRTYFPARLVRLYLPTAAAVLLAVASTLLAPRQAGPGRAAWVAAHAEPHPPLSLLRDAGVLLGVDTLDTPLWSLQWEVLFSLLLPAAVALAVAVRSRPLLACLLLLAASALGMEALVRSSGALAALLLGAVAHLPMFLIGAVIAVRPDRFRVAAGRLLAVPGRRPRLAAATALVVAGLCSPWTLLPLPGGVQRLLAPASVAAGALAVVLALTAPAAARFLGRAVPQRLGRTSFSLYLVHEPVLVSLASVLPPPLAWLAVVLGVPLSFAVAAVFLRLVEGPAHSLAAAILRPRPVA